VVDYPFWQRFLPLSILFHRNDVSAASVYYTKTILQKTSEEQANALSLAPSNARLAMEAGELIATPEVEGSEVNTDAVYAAITQSTPLLGGVTDVAVAAKPVEPAQTARSLQAVRSAAEAALVRQVRIVVDNRTFMPDETIIATWLQITANEAGEPVLAIADDSMNNYFNSIDDDVGVAAGVTNINLRDGREINRTEGQVGRAIDRTALRTELADWLLAGNGHGTFTAVVKDVAPSVMYDNKYTATEQGLRAYVEDAAQRMNVRIAIQQVDGGQWSASAKADESIPSASTYKLFVTKWLFDQMDKGLVQWDDPMLDTTVSVCFDRMTIASTNPCAESWLAQAGRSNFNQYIYGLGFSNGTSFTMPDATHTTANDLQKMMLGINGGSIMNGANRDRLYRSLSTHPYRYGIAAGSGGQVYDKVGFLWDYVHDTAIVRHPKGTYVMTIMTKGQSYATIASLTREIERIMYP
jgi:vancomycin resistance protein YoaR